MIKDVVVAGVVVEVLARRLKDFVVDQIVERRPMAIEKLA